LFYTIIELPDDGPPEPKTRKKLVLFIISMLI